MRHFEVVCQQLGRIHDTPVENSTIDIVCFYTKTRIDRNRKQQKKRSERRKIQREIEKERHHRKIEKKGGRERKMRKKVKKKFSRLEYSTIDMVALI